MNIPTDLANTLKIITVSVIPLLLAITLHEAAHGFMALVFGDDTAKRAGRLSINPIRHIDPFGTIVLPIMLMLATSGRMFGYAKPVPVNYNRLVPQKLGIVFVALAGPLTNLVLAIIFAGLFSLVHLIAPGSVRDFVVGNLQRGFSYNLVFAVLNILPIPPLDGGRIVMALLPLRYSVKLAPYERYMIMGLMLAMILPIVGPYVYGYLVGVPASWLGDQIAALFGV